MVMRPIVGPDGQPLHRVSRELIRPDLPRALGEWQGGVEAAIEAEHSAGGRHVDLRFPKAAIWIKNIERTGSIAPGSVIGTEPAFHGSNCEFVAAGISGGVREGHLTFFDGFPGTFAVLDADWWDHPGGPERRWEISGDTLIVRLAGVLNFGVVIY